MDLQTARVEAGLTVAALAREARVDRKTVERAEAGERITLVKGAAIARAVSKVLGRTYTVSDLNISVS